MKKRIDTPQKLGFKPSDFMRQRHPDQFSDSKVHEEFFLRKEEFEYHLETLTQRCQEKDFEVFCRSLAEKEICPNLNIQTGPTGGGDSKVDSETYPVSDDISLKWYEGLGRRAASERWAFAFSAKKEWKSKVKSDVKNIDSTGRKYNRIFFMSNQAIPDKKRAETEDKLTKEYGTPVNIFDRYWIIDKIYTKRRFDIAISALNLTPKKNEISTIGPGDTEKIAELEKVEKRIDNFSVGQHSAYQFVEDCIYAAVIYRELEKQKLEVYGLFERAKYVAAEYGIKKQLNKAIYQFAWTVYWWYEDFTFFSQLYSDLEEQVVKTEDVWELENLCTLWTLLQTAENRGYLQKEKSQVDKRYNTLEQALDKIASNELLPNTSLTAKSNLTILKLVNALRKGGVLKEIFQELGQILDSAENLLDVPIEKLTKIIEQLSESLDEADGFDDLFEKIIEISEKRISNGEKGRLLIKNGTRKLRCDKNYDAIKFFGRATKFLLQHENRDDFIMAQASIGLAYERIGLLWAARGSYALALNQALKYFSENGEMPGIISTLYYHLIWIEIKIGRVPYALSWLNAKNIIDSEMFELDPPDEYESMDSIDLIMGILILKTRYNDLGSMPFLPSLLEKIGLELSRIAALYALGYEEPIKYEFKKDVSNLFEFFTNWLNRPANTELPNSSEWYIADRISLESSLIGMKLIISLPNNPELQTFAEALLSSAECFLATGVSHKIVPTIPVVECALKLDTSLSQVTLEEEEDDCGNVAYIVAIPKGKVLTQFQDKNDLSRIFEIVVTIISKSIMNFLEIENMIIEDLAFDRMNQFLQFPNIIVNLFGSNIPGSIKKWEKAAGPERFALMRTKPWSDNLYHSNSSYVNTEAKTVEQDGYQISEGKHSDRVFVSIVNPRLWDKANWNALAVAIDKNRKPIVLILGLVFRNEDGALKIFRGWNKLIGNEDCNEIIKISIITGIDRNHPSDYKVMISSNFKEINKDDKQLFMFSSRMLTMNPENSVNLDTFQRFFSMGHGYYLVPAIATSSNLRPTFVDKKYWIKKNDINIIEAWKIKEHDTESVAITSDLEPIIPDSVKNAPVLSIIKKRKINNKTA